MIYNFGSINIDHVYRVPHFVQPGETLASVSLQTVLGGKGANQSVALARAGCKVRHIGRLGSADNWALQELLDAGVDTSLVALLDEPSGHAIIQVDDNGENAIVLHGGANKSFVESEITQLLAEADQSDWLLLQNECSAIDTVFAEARQRQLKIVFNPAPMSADVMELPLDLCEVLIVNEVEASALAGFSDSAMADEGVVIQHLLTRFPETLLVLTLGSKGAKLISKGNIECVSAQLVEAVDTTGAGDTFVGYFLAGLIEKMSHRQALELACRAAALSVMRQGAVPSIPLRGDL